MMVRISGGIDAQFEPAFMFLKKYQRNYPIRGTLDDVSGISYCSGPMVWIDTTILPQYFLERREIKPLQNGRRRTLFVENCNAHNGSTELNEALASFNSELHYFPANCTDHIQPCDSFIIQKIKKAWNLRW